MGYFADKFSGNLEIPNSPALNAVNTITGVSPIQQTRIRGDVKTLEGLEGIARDAGLADQAKKILSSKGEDPNRIFSGGFISDAFDALNALQYGVVGVVKGKTFAEGVRTRQSFTDKDALGDLGLPGVILGTIGDIALDPLTYLGGFGILKRVITGIGKIGAAKKVGALAKASKAGQYLGRKFVYRFGQDPIYKQIATRTERAVAVGIQNAVEIVKPLLHLTSKKFLILDGRLPGISCLR